MVYIAGLKTASTTKRSQEIIIIKIRNKKGAGVLAHAFKPSSESQASNNQVDLGKELKQLCLQLGGRSIRGEAGVKQQLRAIFW